MPYRGRNSAKIDVFAGGAYRFRLPDFFPKHDKFHIHKMGSASGKTEGKRGGKDKSHPYVLHWKGNCRGIEDGCKSIFNAGITEDDLTNALADDNIEFVKASMTITGNCKHLWKKRYSKVTGRARRAQVVEIASGKDRTMPPARRAKSNLGQVDNMKLALGNHGDQSTDRKEQHEMSREAKAKIMKDLNLTDSPLANLINMPQKLRELDKADRETLGDDSDDCLGFVQDSGFHDGFKAVLYSKQDVKVKNTAFHCYLFFGV